MSLRKLRERANAAIERVHRTVQYTRQITAASREHLEPYRAARKLSLPPWIDPTDRLQQITYELESLHRELNTRMNGRRDSLIWQAALLTDEMNRLIRHRLQSS